MTRLRSNHPSTPQRRCPPRRRGGALIYVAVAMVALMGFCSLAVDLGRVQTAKSQLQAAADAGARYAISNISLGVTAAQLCAQTAAAQNSADGTAVLLDVNQDIEFGNWSATTKAFTALSGTARASATAIRVTARRTSARGDAVPLMFAKVVGRNTFDVQAVAVATSARLADTKVNVPAMSNPWLAGMPNGTVANVGNPANNPDYAPTQSPKQISNLSLTAGDALTFDSIAGAANNGGTGSTTYGPDGNTGDIGWNTGGVTLYFEHGKSNLVAPLNSVIGVFLDDNNPASYPLAPTPLLFHTQALRDFTTIAPELRQTFFIGDGRTSGGVIQKFTVPVGATRLFIGTMDRYEWNNNNGSFDVTVYRDGAIRLVK